MAMVDKTGRLVRFTVRPEDAAKAPELPTLLDGVLTGELIADKAYDSDPLSCRPCIELILLLTMNNSG